MDDTNAHEETFQNVYINTQQAKSQRQVKRERKLNDKRNRFNDVDYDESWLDEYPTEEEEAALERYLEKREFDYWHPPTESYEKD